MIKRGNKEKEKGGKENKLGRKKKTIVNSCVLRKKRKKYKIRENEETQCKIIIDAEYK